MDPRNADHALLTQRVRSWIEGRINAAHIQILPFPYLKISEIFPQDVFAKVLEYNLFHANSGREWHVKPDPNRLGVRTPYEHRKQIDLGRPDDYDAPSGQRLFWGAIAAAFLSDNWFLELVASKFRVYFELRFGEAVQQPEFWKKFRRELFLQRHDPGYHIGPHTDVPSRVFTCIFSFADKEGFEEFGTQILRHRDPYVRCSGRQHHSFEDYELIETVPYRPNQFLLFFKTRQSFHAVKTITPDVPNQRYGMQFQCYEPGIGLFRDLSHPDLMASKLMRPTTELYS